MNIVGFVITKNNSDLLEKSVNKIPDCINTIFVSDDNSIDNPEKITKKLNIPIYKNKRSAGYGSNVKNGLDIAFNQYNAQFSQIETSSDEDTFLMYWEDDRSSGKEFVTNISIWHVLCSIINRNSNSLVVVLQIGGTTWRLKA